MNFVVGDMVGWNHPYGYVEYVGVVWAINPEDEYPVAVKDWMGNVGRWYSYTLVPYTKGVDVLPDWLEGDPNGKGEGSMSARCRMCERWFDWDPDWGIEEEDYEGAYCGGSYLCCP